MSAPDTAGSVLEEAAAWLQYQFAAGEPGGEPRGPAPALASLAQLHHLLSIMASAVGARLRRGLDWPVAPSVAALLRSSGPWGPADWLRLVERLAAEADQLDAADCERRRALADAAAAELVERGAFSAATWAALAAYAPDGPAAERRGAPLIV